jgi:hypothetical protein
LIKTTQTVEEGSTVFEKGEAMKILIRDLFYFVLVVGFMCLIGVGWVALAKLLLTR